VNKDKDYRFKTLFLVELNRDVTRMLYDVTDAANFEISGYLPTLVFLYFFYFLHKHIFQVGCPCWKGKILGRYSRYCRAHSKK